MTNGLIFMMGVLSMAALPILWYVAVRTSLLHDTVFSTNHGIRCLLGDARFCLFKKGSIYETKNDIIK